MAPAPAHRKEILETATAPSIRNVVLAVAVSLDGYIARRDGSVDWLIEDPTVDLSAYGKVFDTIVAGRKTLDVEKSSGGGGGPFGDMVCYIFSRTRPPGKRAGAEYVNRSPGEFVRELKVPPGKDIWLMGGGELAREFLREDLVDGMDLPSCRSCWATGFRFFHQDFLSAISRSSAIMSIPAASFARSTRAPPPRPRQKSDAVTGEPRWPILVPISRPT